MIDKPILFSGPMVRALIEGRKTQTRRVLKPQPFKKVADFQKVFAELPYFEALDHAGTPVPCAFKVGKHLCTPYPKIAYAAGDRLWVREAHYLTNKHAYRLSTGVEQQINPNDDYEACVFKEGFDRSTGGMRLRPSIHMPRWASRLTLTVTNVRVQRLCEISEEDVRAEGCADEPMYPEMGTAVHAFQDLWDSLNAERGFGWDANPWVAAYTFTVHKCNIEKMRSEA